MSMNWIHAWRCGPICVTLILTVVSLLNCIISFMACGLSFWLFLGHAVWVRVSSELIPLCEFSFSSRLNIVLEAGNVSFSRRRALILYIIHCILHLDCLDNWALYLKLFIQSKLLPVRFCISLSRWMFFTLWSGQRHTEIFCDEM